MCSHNHWFQLLYQWKNIHHKRSSSRSPQINNNGESFEENNKVEDDIKEKIFGGIFMEGDEKEKSCLSAIYVDFSRGAALDISQRKLKDEFFFKWGCLIQDGIYYYFR